MASHTDISEILLRFPDPVTLYPACKKRLLVFAGGAMARARVGVTRAALKYAARPGRTFSSFRYS
jgi:hypothetical protein